MYQTSDPKEINKISEDVKQETQQSNLKTYTNGKKEDKSALDLLNSAFDDVNLETIKG